MLTSTPGLVLHTTPYGESSVVARVFTRQLGARSYMVKGVRTARSRVKQNLLQPLSSLDMVVYDSLDDTLGHIRELSPRRPVPPPDAVGNALRFFMTEVLYRALREAEPMPDFWDYVDQSASLVQEPVRDIPVRFLLQVSYYLGVSPLDNYTPHTPYFDLQLGRFAASPVETTLSAPLSASLHAYLTGDPNSEASALRHQLLDALLAYFQLHLSGFRNFASHEILHTILR